MKIINENLGKLLAEAADYLDESKGVQITSNDIARTLLRILPTGKPPIVPERAHQDAIDDHTELLARSGEMIRRELLPLVILASNYVDQARRAHADLEVLLDFIIPVLKPEQLLSLYSSWRSEYRPGSDKQRIVGRVPTTDSTLLIIYLLHSLHTQIEGKRSIAIIDCSRNELTKA